MCANLLSSSAWWRERFVGACLRAQAIDPLRCRHACGLSNNVDVLISVNARTMLPLTQLRLPERAEAASAIIATPEALALCLRTHMLRGAGGEVAIATYELGSWLAHHFQGPKQTGGTGAQAANTLAQLGYPALLHLTARSRLDIELLVDPQRLLLATPAGLRRPAEAICASDKPAYHYVFNFDDCTRVKIGGAAVRGARPNRLIVSDDRVNRILPLDPCFFEAIAKPDLPVERVLLSGYTQMADVSLCHQRIKTTLSAIAGWRKAHPGLLIHLELAAALAPGIMAAIMGGLAPHVDSIGLNEDELVEIGAVRDAEVSQHPSQQVMALQRLLEQIGIRRVGLHTQRYCLALTTTDPEREQAALLFAALTASVRAGTARLPTFEDLYRKAAAVTITESALQAETILTEVYGLTHGITRLNECWLVFAPVPHVSRIATTIGLGDSFAAGLLLLL
jgi:ADP-dependent phosphofructokinase/glucokinase